MEKEMVGTYGEYFVVTRLLSWGFPAAIVPGPFSYDVVADINGTPVRVQVKTTNKVSKSRSGKDVFRFDCRHTAGRNSSKSGSYGPQDYDIMVCVAVPNFRMMFLPNGKRVTLERAATVFNREEERKSWDSCLKSLGLIK